MADIPQLWQQHFPELAADDTPAMQSLREHAALARLPAGQPVFHVGNACEQYLLVVAGSVRVRMITESGREAVLYRVGPGQTCILTTSCLLAGEHYPAEGITDTEVEALTLRRREFETGLDGSATFRRFVFASLGQRLADVIRRIDEVAFQSVERRLARYLLAHADSQGCLHVTHQDLASELGSAREVVSRHLKRLEARGLLRLQRSSITLVQHDSLATLAQHAV
ncbi:MAG: Crp/Fnr family transcriptional regulator [Thiohalophilus sp.]